jgi:hypothetical protein
MIKILECASLCAILIFGFVGAVFGQAYPPMRAPDIRYVMPGVVAVHPNHQLYQGRSIYRMGDPGAFYNGVDEAGYPTGLPENPPSN